MTHATNHELKIRKRIQLVHIAANELGIDDADYRAILARWNRPGTGSTGSPRGRQPVTSSLQMSYQQLGELLDFLEALGFKLRTRRENHPSPQPSPREGRGSERKKYPSSMDGLRQEVRDLAQQRWGENWERSLNNLCRKFGVSHHRFLDMGHAKAIKTKLIKWEASDDGQRERETVERSEAVGEGPGVRSGAGKEAPGTAVLHGDEGVPF